MFSVTIHAKGLAEIQAGVDKVIKEFPKMTKKASAYISEIGEAKAHEILETESQFGTPGHQLRNSIIKQSLRGGNAWRIYTNYIGAEYAEFGTDPHPIRMPYGSKGDRLALGWHGNNPNRKYGGFRKHFHPGSIGLGYMKRAFQLMKVEAINSLKDMGDKSISFFK